MVDLPSLNRDITTLVEMVPGARQVQGVTAGGSQVIDLSGNFALGAGTRRSQSVFYIDGSENMGAWRLQALQMPNPDTIQEVQVIASSASAEFGKEPGMSMNAITKSGTNDLHGTAFFATHATNLNANTWSCQPQREPPADGCAEMDGRDAGRADSKESHVLLRLVPALLRQRSLAAQQLRMPTQAMVDGDFTDGVPIPPASASKRIDPEQGKPSERSSPRRLINPISAKLAARHPHDPGIQQRSGARPFLLGRSMRPAHSNEWLGKIDHRLSDRPSAVRLLHDHRRRQDLSGWHLRPGPTTSRGGGAIPSRARGSTRSRSGTCGRPPPTWSWRTGRTGPPILLPQPDGRAREPRHARRRVAGGGPGHSQDPALAVPERRALGARRSVLGHRAAELPRSEHDELAHRDAAPATAK